MRPIALLPLALAALTALPAAAQTLDRIRELGEIRLGVRADAAPMSFVDADGVARGYTVDVCNRVTAVLAPALGLDEITPVYVTVTSEGRFDAVATGEVDLLCGATTVTLDRREVVDFSLPIFIDGAAVLIPRGGDPTFSALAGKKIGVRAGTTTETVLQNSLAAAGMEAELVQFDDHAAGLAAIEAGEIDAYFGDQSILFGLLFSSDDPAALSISDNTLTVEKQALALARGDTDFRLAVDRAISELYLGGAMAEVFKTNLPGATPGRALEALFLIAPDLP